MRALHVQWTPHESASLSTAFARGWTIDLLVEGILTDWPPAVRSPSSLIVARLHYLAEIDPPVEHPSRRNPPLPTGPRHPMPESVREYLHGRPWWQ
jgi:hypothetical protein